ncbi:MAG: 50S ribosome-binding GTPase [Nocardioidaceae bacterium]
MTAVVEGAKRLLGSGAPTLATRVAGLQEAVEASRGRLPDAVIEDTEAIATRAAQRVAIAGGHTVVALAGATGSGKSSTFNALAEMDVANVGVRRPTTSWTMSCTWGSDSAGPLLDWLDVPPRHRVSHDSMLEERRVDRDLQGLVLLDLPDHDSTDLSHHIEMGRFIELADLMVWVLDPQKYADAALHDRFLKPMAMHAANMMVVLNHIDVVPEDRRDAMVADLRGLLKDDGLGAVPVIVTSARYGEGIAELKDAIARRVRDKAASLDRLSIDVQQAARALQELSGTAPAGDIARQSKAELVDAFADAAGVPTVVSAVNQAARRRGAQATGWPLTKWLGRLRRDPLRRLHLDLGDEGRSLAQVARTSVPEATPVQRARVDLAVRGVADSVGAELAAPWASAVRAASTSRLDDLGDALDKAVAGTDLGVARTPVLWRLIQVLQVVLFGAAVVGALWLLGLAVTDYLKMEEPTTPRVAGMALPTLLLLAGVVAGIGLAVVFRWLGGLRARSKARAANRRLRDAISDVTEELVIAPIETEVAAYSRARSGLAAALS